MNSQTTIHNHLQLQHVLHMGLMDARYEYIMDQKRERDAGFFEALSLTDLKPGAKVKIRRGDCDITLRCKEVSADTCEWEKVRV